MQRKSATSSTSRPRPATEIAGAPGCRMPTRADEPGMVKVRILDQQGRVSSSTDAAQVSHVLHKTAEACYGCHTQSQPLARLNRPDRFRIYRNGGGQRVLGII